MGYPLECTIKYIHNRFERIPRGKRIRIAPLCHAEVDTESFLSLYNIYRGSVTLHQKRNVGPTWIFIILVLKIYIRVPYAPPKKVMKRHGRQPKPSP